MATPASKSTAQNLDEINKDALSLIFNKLATPGDRHRFRAVCKAFDVAGNHGMLSTPSFSFPGAPMKPCWSNFGPALAQVFPGEAAWKPISLHSIVVEEEAAPEGFGVMLEGATGVRLRNEEAGGAAEAAYAVVVSVGFEAEIEVHAVEQGEEVEVAVEEMEEEEYEEEEDDGDDDDDGDEEETCGVIVHLVPVKDERLSTICIGSSRGFLGFYDSEFTFFLMDARTSATVELPTPYFLDILSASKTLDGGMAYTSPITGNTMTMNFFHTWLFTPSSLVLSPPTAATRVTLCRIVRANNALVFCMPWGPNHFWQLVPPKLLPHPFHCTSHIYHRGEFYLLDRISSRVFACNISTSDINLHHIEVSHYSLSLVQHAMLQNHIAGHLVECGGDLFLVVENVTAYTTHLMFPKRANKNALDAVLSLRIFKLVGSADRPRRWMEVFDLGRHSLFLGFNDAFALSVLDYPGFERNCVYLTGWSRLFFRRSITSRIAPYNYLVYHIADGRFEKVDGDDLPLWSFQSFWLDPRLNQSY